MLFGGLVVSGWVRAASLRAQLERRHGGEAKCQPD